MLVGLNLVGVRALNARRRGRTTDSDSDRERWEPFSHCYDWCDATDDDCDDVALRETCEIADAIRRKRPMQLPPRRSNRCHRPQPLPSEATARGVAGLIPLEVFRLFGGRRRHMDTLDLQPFVSYLARCAPHLREVGLFGVEASAVLPLRRTISLVFNSLDLRHIWGLDDSTLATLLRYPTGRQLHSLKIVHKNCASLFDNQWYYNALGYGGAREDDVDDEDYFFSDETDSDGDGNNPPVPRCRPAGLLLRRAHIDLNPAFGPSFVDVKELWELDPRAVQSGLRSEPF
jgi:hypothetical protein